MILLDTNVLSEPLKPRPDAAVLPAGRRRTALAQALERQVLPLFEGRVLPFDTEAARAFAAVQGGATAAGNPVSFADAAMAAIAAARGFALATRILRDFKGTGVDLIDPWGDALG